MSSVRKIDASRGFSPEAFGKVAVMMGGWSAERDISLLSGNAVCEALCSRGINAVAVDVSRDDLFAIGQAGFDRAFVIMHGTGGEDGAVQAVLDLLGIAYTGSGVAASAIAMDKLLSKRIWRAQGLPVPEGFEVRNGGELLAAAEKLSYPLIVKPAAEGSSVGISKVKSDTHLKSAFELARGNTGRTVMAERFVKGGEYTCAILGDQCLPIVRIDPDGEFYDFNAKYVSEKTSYHCPSGLSDTAENQLTEIARRAFSALGASGWGRVDFLLDEAGKPWLLEANLVPGMTCHSLVPMAASHAGLSFADLCCEILAQTLTDQRPNA